jgi:hypothetical protein
MGARSVLGGAGQEVSFSGSLKNGSQIHKSMRAHCRQASAEFAEETKACINSVLRVRLTRAT